MDKDGEGWEASAMMAHGNGNASSDGGVNEEAM